MSIEVLCSDGGVQLEMQGFIFNLSCSDLGLKKRNLGAFFMLKLYKLHQSLQVIASFQLLSGVSRIYCLCKLLLLEI